MSGSEGAFPFTLPLGVSAISENFSNRRDHVLPQSLLQETLPISTSSLHKQ